MTAFSFPTRLSTWRRGMARTTGLSLPEDSLTAGNSDLLPSSLPEKPGRQVGALSSWGEALAPWIAPDGGDMGGSPDLSEVLITGFARRGGGGLLTSRRELLLVGKDGYLQAEATSGLSGLGDGLAPRLGPNTKPLCSCALCQGMAVGARRELIDRFGARPSDQDLNQAVAVLRPGHAQPQPAGPGGLAAAPLAASTSIALSLSIADNDVFNLETNPGGSKTIYLNFLGANLSGTAWIPNGSSWNGVAPAFTLDSDTSTNFNAAELTAIKEIFARVACDYAPFNVNVTTKAPTNERINRSTNSDSVYGTVCLFSNISSQTGYSNAGGVAYVGVFNGVNYEYYKPALVFPNNLGNSAKNIAEAASHEIGHNLNLLHDGTSTTGYYQGQGSSPGWAPIMGVGYYKTLTQFSRGTYSGANNAENDFSLIAGQGVGYWGDFVGNDRTTAKSLVLLDANGDGLSDKLQIGGSIELTASDGLGTPDQDFYSFLAPSNGSVTINVRNALYYFDPTAAQYTFAPVPTGFGNLRLDARLLNASGSVLADWSNNASLDVANFSVSGLAGGQNYYLSVLANTASPDGEGSWGSLGDYVIDLVYQGQSGASALPLPSFSLSGPTSVQEGQPLTIGIATTNVADGTSLSWRLSGTGVTAEDFAPAALSGSVTVNAGAASVPLTVAPDNTIETTETALFELLNGSAVVASRSISLLDTNVLWGDSGTTTITGTSNRFERITGVSSGGTTGAELGTAQKDLVTGGAGADEFLLSEIRSGSLRVFYNDTVANNTGTNDYLKIGDFNAIQDKLRFGGGRYFSRNTGTDTWIWHDRNDNGALNTTTGQKSSDELIAILSSVNLGNFTLTSSSTLSWAVFG